MPIHGDMVTLRIDDRLIHGQVITTWVKSFGIQSILVVSDRAADEPLEVILLKSSVPIHLSLEVLSVKQATTKLQEFAARKTLVLLERIEDALALCTRYPEIQSVNLGGLRYRPGKTGLNKAVYVTPEEQDLLMELHSRGVKVWLQVVPTDAKVLAADKLSQR